MSHFDLLDCCLRAADRAAAYVRGAVRPADPAAWDRKASRDFATEVDRTAESLITASLLGEMPGTRVLGEEHSPDAPLDGLVWVVDPLDGTTNFLHGFPHYAVSIAAAVDGHVVAGVVENIPTGERFHAARGRGAWRGEARLAVSTIADPALALVGTGYPFKDGSRIDDYLAQFRRVALATSGMRRAGSAALDLADVACGRFELFWEQRLAPWDIAAGLLLVEEAGGRATDLAGDPLALRHTSVLAGNAALHGWMREVLRDG